MDNSTKKSLLCACGAMIVAALLLGGLAALDALPTIPLATPTNISASSVSGLMMVLCSALAVWGGTIYFRCSDQEIRKRLIIICGLVIFWIITSLLKYCARSTEIITFMWYLFYAPMLFIPTQFLFCVLHASSHRNIANVKRAQHVVFTISALMLAFVLTNNVHFAVFQFDYGSFALDGEYTYNWGYAVVLGWSLLLMGASFILVGVNARHNLLPSLLLIMGVFALLMLYGTLYITRIAPVFTSNITMDYTVFIFTIAELCLRLKILPTYSSFRQLFRKLPLDTKILDRSGNVVMQTDSAQPLPFRVQKRCINSTNAQQTFSFSDQPTSRFRTFPLNGGVVVLTEDITPVVKNQSRLTRLRRKLQRQNRLLQQDGAMKSQLFMQQRKRQLYDEIRATLSSTVSEIGQRIEDLPDQSTPEGAAQRKRELLQIKMLIAYCKRKGSLILNKSDANPDFNRERISLVTNETASDLRAAGIECAALVETHHNLPAETVSILYDCFYDFCMASFYYENPAIMFFLHDKADSPNIVEMKLALESDSEQEPENHAAIDKLQETLSQHNVAYRLVSEEGMLNLTVLAQKNASPATSGGAHD